jgi:hypothetical protein
MMDNRLTMNFCRVSKKHPCEICHHHDWCTFTLTTAFCARVSHGSFRTAKNGAYMHRTDAQQPKAPVHRLASRNVPSRAEEERLDRVYRGLLSMLSLSADHREDLRRRGLDDAFIDDRIYRSTPAEEKIRAIINKLEPFGLEGVPGFHKIGTEWQLVKIPSGMLVPVCSQEGLISGIQIRLENSFGNRKYLWLSSAHQLGGSSSGAPLHWSKPELISSAGDVLLTEGGLKGDVIAYFLGAPVIAAAGVALFGRNFGATLKMLYPDINAVIALDSDWRRKLQVRAALIALQKQLTSARVNWKVRCWPTEYKGYDDFLLALREKETAA